MAERIAPRTADEPVASRPLIEGYGVPESAEGMLPWRHAEERLASARNYWVVTASPDGRPHAVPVWGLWLDGRLYFGTGATTRTGRNLATNDQIAVHLESGDDVVILEGRVETVRSPAPELSRALDDAYPEKYDWRPSAEQAEPVGEGMYVVRPRVAFAWTSFPQDTTRWRFPTG